MRYFAELAYNGTKYNGWQKQSNATTVQEVLENGFSTILGRPVELTGCGRTDTGVHASQFFAHFDLDEEVPDWLCSRLNRFLPPDLVLRRFLRVPDGAHARFDAIRRSYAYHLVFEKDPFSPQTAWHFPFAEKPDLERMQEAAALLLQYDQFSPFCKTHSDARTMFCQLMRSEWQQQHAGHLVYHISANRFLRGMVRLVVGMCLNVGMGRLEHSEVASALDRQQPLRRSWSVPPQGLFLTEVIYPEDVVPASRP
jgi:tRNA pseudouridine38-40 synthase